MRMGSSVRGAIDLVLLLTACCGCAASRAGPGARPPGTPRTPRCPGGSASPRASSARRVGARRDPRPAAGPPTQASRRKDPAPGRLREKRAAAAESTAPSTPAPRPRVPAGRRARPAAARCSCATAFDEVSPEVGRAGRGGVRGPDGRGPGRRGGDAGRPGAATDRELRAPRGGWPPGSSCGSAGSGRPRPGHPAAGGDPRGRGRPRPRPDAGRAGPASGRPVADDLVTRNWTGTGGRSAWWSTGPGRCRASAVASAAVAAAGVVLAADERLETSVLDLHRRGDRCCSRRAAQRAAEDVVLRAGGPARARADRSRRGARGAHGSSCCRRPADERVVVLLSDCLSTGGGRRPRPRWPASTACMCSCPLPTDGGRDGGARAGRPGRRQRATGPVADRPRPGADRDCLS